MSTRVIGKKMGIDPKQVRRDLENEQVGTVSPPEPEPARDIVAGATSDAPEHEPARDIVAGVTQVTPEPEPARDIVAGVASAIPVSSARTSCRTRRAPRPPCRGSCRFPTLVEQFHQCSSPSPARSRRAGPAASSPRPAPVPPAPARSPPAPPLPPETGAPPAGGEPSGADRPARAGEGGTVTVVPHRVQPSAIKCRTSGRGSCSIRANHFFTAG